MDTGTSNPIAEEEKNITEISKEVEALRKCLDERNGVIARLRELIQQCHSQVCLTECKPTRELNFKN